jgi:hypothetical protein
MARVDRVSAHDDTQEKDALLFVLGDKNVEDFASGLAFCRSLRYLESGDGSGPGGLPPSRPICVRGLSGYTMAT